MQIIPLKAVPSQAVTVTLAGQLSQINIYQKLYGLSVDLYVNNALVLAGSLALDRNLIVGSAYLNFIGDLTFVDNQGANDPTYDGLNSRYYLAYIAQSELITTPTATNLFSYIAQDLQNYLASAASNLAANAVAAPTPAPSQFRFTTLDSTTASIDSTGIAV